MGQAPKKRILIIIPNLGRGGAQKIFLQQLRYFSADHDVTGCVFNWDGAFEDDHHPNIVSLDVPAGKTIIEKCRFFIRRINGVRRLKQQRKIELAISHLEGADYVNIMSGTCRTICWIHGTKIADKNISGWAGWLRKRIMIPSLYKRTELITVSEGIRQELIKHFALAPDRIRTIYNGIDLAGISESISNSSNAAPEWLSHHKVLITHCRLSVQKNLDALLIIYSLIIKTDPEVKLIIIGDGELRQQLLLQAEELGLKTYNDWKNHSFESTFQIYFTGHKANPYSYLQKASLFVMTSSWEGFPLSLCEAMACRLPALAADCPTGPAEIFEKPHNDLQEISLPWFGPAGVLMPMAEKESYGIWAQTIIRVLSDDRLRSKLSEHAWLRAQAFDQGRIFSEWNHIL